MNNITERDLMVGDWVYYKDKKQMPCRVTSIVGNYIRFDDGTPQDWMVDVKNFTPIPLTAEILKKNGFEKVNGEYQDEFYCCDGLDLLIDDRLEPWCYTLFGVLELPIRYVHILQHALRLAGIEKTIEL